MKPNINLWIGYFEIFLSILFFIFGIYYGIEVMIVSIFCAIHGKINYDWGKEHENKK